MVLGAIGHQKASYQQKAGEEGDGDNDGVRLANAVGGAGSHHAPPKPRAKSH